MDFPHTKPSQDPVFLWHLQQFLLREAETRLGKSGGKTVYQPKFSPSGPNIVNTPTLDGSFAVLSRAAENYWPTLYELAHETVHILDPKPGCTNYLEEGVAVEFAVLMSRLHTSHPQTPQTDGYLEPLRRVREISGDPLGDAKAIRQLCGALHLATSNGIKQLFPLLTQKQLAGLTECIPRVVPKKQ